MLFHKIEEAQVILRSKGVFRQVPLYRRGDELFAKHGSGFIGLRRYNGTTASHVSWDYIEGVEFTETRDVRGALTLKTAEVARAA